jgi:hypothetical protein
MTKLQTVNRILPIVQATGEVSVSFPLKWTLPDQTKDFDDPELTVLEASAFALSGELCARLVIQQETHYVVPETGLVEKATTLHTITELVPVPGVKPGDEIEISSEANLQGQWRTESITVRGKHATLMTGDCRLTLEYTVYEQREITIYKPGDADASFLAETVNVETLVARYSDSWDLALPVSFEETPQSLGTIETRFVNAKVTPMRGWLKLEGEVVATVPYQGSRENTFVETFVFPIKRYLEATDAGTEMLADCTTQIQLFTCQREPGSNKGVLRGLLHAGARLSRIEPLEVAADTRSDQHHSHWQDPFLLDQVLGTGSSQTLIQREIFFSRPARKVREPVDAEVRNLRAEIIANKVIVRGVLHKQIFAVDAETGVVFAQDVDESFVHFVDVPGAAPGTRAHVKARVEFVQVDIHPGGLTARQVTIIEITVKVTRAVKKDIVTKPPFCPVSPVFPSHPKPQPIGRVYIVRSGDSIWKIARMFGVTMESIIAANNLQNPNLIFPGQNLIIPG